MIDCESENEESCPIVKHPQKTYGSSGGDETDIVKTSEPATTRLPYPTGVVFILCSKFFESFSANGVRTVLALYLRDTLFLSENVSTTVLHAFNFFGQFCPLLGAVLADSYLGSNRTITFFIMPYAAGYILLNLVTYPLAELPVQLMVFCGLTLISIGNGSIRACITSLGGSQFQLPEQKNGLDRYFSHYYFVYTMGVLLSKIVPPEIRAATQCFGKTNCYAIVFGFLALVFLASAIVFLIGKFCYKPDKINDENILFQVIGCTWHALTEKIKGNSHHQRWILASVGKYPAPFVRDVYKYLRVVRLFLPLPIYWSLLAQQDSTWTFQASQMDTTIYGFKIEADQVKALGPIFLLFLIPFWEKGVDPLLNKLDLNILPLQKVAVGGLCAAVSFVCAGLLQIQIENENATPPSILWQIPQFFLLMMGEVLLSIPGLQFAFTQAPATMKSVLTASWFVNNAIGNLIVVILTAVPPVDLQSSEFFVYAILMFIATIVFSMLALNNDGPDVYDDGDIDFVSNRSLREKFMFLQESTKVSYSTYAE